jgi:hypothetical protein
VDHAFRWPVVYGVVKSMPVALGPTHTVCCAGVKVLPVIAGIT